MLWNPTFSPKKIKIFSVSKPAPLDDTTTISIEYSPTLQDTLKRYEYQQKRTWLFSERKKLLQKLTILNHEKNKNEIDEINNNLYYINKSLARLAYGRLKQVKRALPEIDEALQDCKQEIEKKSNTKKLKRELKQIEKEKKQCQEESVQLQKEFNEAREQMKCTGLNAFRRITLIFIPNLEMKYQESYIFATLYNQNATIRFQVQQSHVFPLPVEAILYSL